MAIHSHRSPTRTSTSPMAPLVSRQTRKETIMAMSRKAFEERCRKMGLAETRYVPPTLGDLIANQYASRGVSETRAERVREQAQRRVWK